MSLINKFLIIVALALGLFLRLYRLNFPIADWHSHRQADTASVTRIFAYQELNLLRPKYHDLSNVQSGQENPFGYRMVEFPIYNYLSVLFYQTFQTNIEISSRLVSIIFSLASALLVFLICYRLTRLFFPSFLALSVFLFLPFSIYYSRTVIPEPTAVFFMLLSLYFFRFNTVISGLFLGLSVLIKPFTAIIIFPSLLLIAWQKYHSSPKIRSFIALLSFSIISLLPFYLWRRWINQFPEGIPKSDWLLNNSDSTTFPNWYHGYNLTFLNKLVAFRPHWFYWLFKERLANLILGTFGIVPLFLGFAYRKNQTQKFSFSLILGILLYFIIIAQGNIQHDYYQILIIPSLSILCGFGLYYLYQFIFKSKLISFFSIVIIALLSLYFSWDQIKGYYQINNPAIITAGKKAQDILPQNSLVVAPYTGDTAFLYQTGFSGWPVEVYDIEKILREHPDQPFYFVSVNFDQYTNTLINKFPVVLKNSDYVILKLSP